ncbi:hypothetical protein RFI_12337 [Reticulomyxa filosa]|uniref:Uncharacterized protein n=1 Tax=Reticulomyxa filosa TaxID=46433 RepID=X6NFS8_RETFI|nr:hypothetical protein RFI_12337 [Reticulomyxa filosa]|eukprot:ETO24821.1 hypothetical protein RFI_12337 [Reticulomyxa filosa]
MTQKKLKKQKEGYQDNLFEYCGTLRRQFESKWQIQPTVSASKHILSAHVFDEFKDIKNDMEWERKYFTEDLYSELLPLVGNELGMENKEGMFSRFFSAIETKRKQELVNEDINDPHLRKRKQSEMDMGTEIEMELNNPPSKRRRLNQGDFFFF